MLKLVPVLFPGGKVVRAWYSPATPV